MTRFALAVAVAAALTLSACTPRQPGEVPSTTENVIVHLSGTAGRAGCYFIKRKRPAEDAQRARVSAAAALAVLQGDQPSLDAIQAAFEEGLSEEDSEFFTLLVADLRDLVGSTGIVEKNTIAYRAVEKAIIACQSALGPPPTAWERLQRWWRAGAPAGRA